MALTPEEESAIGTYNRIAQTYAKAHSDLFFWKEEFATFQSFLPKGRILDAGCGTGRDAHMIRSAGYDYVGVDASQQMLGLARLANPDADFRQMDLYELAFEPYSFDGFWAVASFIHAPRERLPQLLDTILDVTKIDGVGFFAMLPGEGTKTGSDGRLYTLYQEEEFANYLRHARMNVLKSGKHEQEGKPPWLTYFVQT